MLNFDDKTIREIALEAPLTIRVFENNRIDFCCGGRVPFREACENADVDPQTIAAELEAAIGEAAMNIAEAAERKLPGELIEHIVSTHHAFTRSEIDRLVPLSEKVAMRHGESHPELLEIRDTFAALGDELLLHMRKEEMMLFPYIGQLERSANTESVPPLPPFGTVNNPVRMMMFEHDQAGEILKKLRLLSDDFTPPEGACPSYKGLFAGLEYFEKDLHRHIHLENNVLFPKAIEMENGALSGAARVAA